MNWLRLRMAADLQATQTISAHLDSLGALAVTITDAADQPILEPAPGETPLWEYNQIEALFDLEADLAAIKAALLEAGVVAVSADFLDDADWQSRWKQHAVQFCFGDRLWIAPKDAEPPGDLTLHLDPGLAFGTGGHPTTRLCLDWLSRTRLDALSLLDLGCGSGILALAALKLGCARVWAVDHDPQAILATTQNAAYNGVRDQRLVVAGNEILAGAGHFDVVVANILAGPLIELAGLITQLTRPGGRIVLSGLLANQIDGVRSAYLEMDFIDPEIETDEQGAEWARLVARRIVR